ncbi:MAG TPA: signal peptidase II [Alphaproteobacteria bacterium]|nr:signal peptidase II [Micavibrio sp.]MBK9561811.1 signal peptidase II [Micavibrio sp.]HQX27111.1 signal peptidase II [Alphaproteobacteria bacterium]
MRPFLILLLSLIFIAADQASKWYVMEHVLRPHAEGEAAAPPPDFLAWYQSETKTLAPTELAVASHFNFVSVWNKGISFGMFNQQSDFGPMILIVLALVISLFFVAWLFYGPDGMQEMGILLVIGGALGNVIDRARYGAVFDFLDFHAFDYHWPAFNIADSGIVIGVGVLILHSFLYSNKY